MARQIKATNARVDADGTIQVDAEMVDSWLTIAEGVDIRPWDEVESLLNELSKKSPLRVAMARRGIRWLRHQALAYNLTWGKEMNSYAQDNNYTQDSTTQAHR